MASGMEKQFPACPFAAQWIEAAKKVFIRHLWWKRIYDNAPPGAKRRLEIAFWFSQNVNVRNERPDLYAKYREWREDMERAMTEEDMIYLIRALDEYPIPREHYKSLLRGFRTNTHFNTSGAALMPYDDFFSMLDGLGEFRSFAYDESTKKSIIADFLPVLKGSGDPLETHIEDILATAKFKEARVYPKDETMYVRVEVRFLTDTAEWSAPYQMVAAWDCFNNLKGYAFPVGKGHRSELPVELKDPENKAQREKRMRLMSARVAATKK